PYVLAPCAAADQNRWLSCGYLMDSRQDVAASTNGNTQTSTTRRNRPGRSIRQAAWYGIGAVPHWRHSLDNSSYIRLILDRACCSKCLTKIVLHRISTGSIDAAREGRCATWPTGK